MRAPTMGAFDDGASDASVRPEPGPVRLKGARAATRENARPGIAGTGVGLGAYLALIFFRARALVSQSLPSTKRETMKDTT